MESAKLAVGQLVQWKPRLRNRSLPSYNGKAVILQLLDTPVRKDALRALGEIGVRDVIPAILVTFRNDCVETLDKLGATDELFELLSERIEKYARTKIAYILNQRITPELRARARPARYNGT